MHIDSIHVSPWLVPVASDVEDGMEQTFYIFKMIITLFVFVMNVFELRKWNPFEKTCYVLQSCTALYTVFAKNLFFHRTGKLPMYEIFLAS